MLVLSGLCLEGFFLIIIMCYSTATVTRQHTNQLNEILYDILLTKAKLSLLFLKLDPVGREGTQHTIILP